MATAELKVTLVLDEKECEALKKFLGDQSVDSYMKDGLTKEQANLCSEIWNLIPYTNE